MENTETVAVDNSSPLQALIGKMFERLDPHDPQKKTNYVVTGFAKKMADVEGKQMPFISMKSVEGTLFITLAPKRALDLAAGTDKIFTEVSIDDAMKDAVASLLATSAAATKPEDAKASDAGAADVKPEDAGAADVKPEDAGAADVKPEDAGAADVKPEDVKADDVNVEKDEKPATVAKEPKAKAEKAAKEPKAKAEKVAKAPKEKSAEPDKKTLCANIIKGLMKGLKGDEVLTRKACIDAMTANLGISAAMASTYHHKLMRGDWQAALK